MEIKTIVQRAREIANHDKFDLTDYDVERMKDLIIQALKEQDKITRHACANNMIDASNGINRLECSAQAASILAAAVINTKAV